MDLEAPLDKPMDRTDLVVIIIVALVIVFIIYQMYVGMPFQSFGSVSQSACLGCSKS